MKIMTYTISRYLSYLLEPEVTTAIKTMMRRK